MEARKATLEPLLTVPEVARILNVPPKMVYEIQELRPLRRMVGRRIRFRRADIEAYVNSRPR